MNKPFLKPLSLIIAAAALLFFSKDTSTQTRADFEQKLTLANQHAARDISVFYKTHAEQLVKLAKEKNTKDALRSFDKAIDQLNPDHPADVDGLRKYYEEEMLPWITNVKRVETEIGKEFEEEEEEEEEEERVGLGVMSLFSSIHISAKLQNRYQAHNPNPPGKHYLFAAETELPDGMDPAVKQYDKIHGQFHPIFFEHLRSNNLYDIFLIAPETRLGRDDSRVIYSVMKEADFPRNMLVGPQSVTELGQVYRMAMNQPEGRVFLTDLKPYLTSGNRPSQFMATPIYDGDEYIGVLAQQINLLHLNRILALDEQEFGYENLISNEFHQVIAGAEDFKWYDTKRIRNQQTVIDLKETGLLNVKSVRDVKVMSAFRPLKLSSKKLNADFSWRIISEIPLSVIEAESGNVWEKNAQNIGWALGIVGLGWLLFVLVGTHGRASLRYLQTNINLGGIMQSVRVRLTVFFILPALVGLAIFLHQNQFNLNKEQDMIKKQTIPLVFQSLETNRLNAESLRLNTGAFLFGVRPGNKHDRTKEYLESLVDDEYKLINRLLKYTDIPPGEIDNLVQPLIEMRGRRDRVIAFYQKIEESFRNLHSLASATTAETEQLILKYPELIEHLTDIDIHVAHILVKAQEVLFGQKTIEQMRVSTTRFNIEIYQHIDDLVLEDVNIANLRHIIDNTINQSNDILNQMEMSGSLFENLQDGYLEYFSSFSTFFDRYNYNHNDIAQLEMDVSENVNKTLILYGIGKHFEEEEEEEEDFSQRMVGLVKGKASFLTELYKELEMIQNRLKDFSKQEQKLTLQFFTNVDGNAAMLEKILQKKKKKKKKSGLDMMDYLFLYQANLLKDAHLIGDYINEVDPLNLNEVFLISSANRQKELLENLRSTGFKDVASLSKQFSERQIIIAEIMRNHRLYIAASHQYENAFATFLDALRGYRTQNYALSTSETLSETIAGFEQARRIQSLLYGLMVVMVLLMLFMAFMIIKKMMLVTDDLKKSFEKEIPFEGDLSVVPSEFSSFAKVTAGSTERFSQLRDTLARVSQLAKERLLSEQIVEAVSSGIVVVNREGRIMQTNASFMRMFKLKKDDVKEQLLSLIKNGLLDLSAIKDALVKVKQTGHPVTNVEADIDHDQLGKKTLNISVFSKLFAEEEEEEVLKLALPVEGAEFTLIGKLFEEEEEEEVVWFLKSGKIEYLSKPIRDMKLHFTDSKKSTHSIAFNAIPFSHTIQSKQFNSVKNGIVIGINDLTEIYQSAKSISDNSSINNMRAALSKMRTHRAAVFTQDHELIAANDLYLKTFEHSVESEMIFDKEGKPLHCYQVSHTSEVPCWEIEGVHPCPIREADYSRAASGMHIHHDTGEPLKTNLNCFPFKDKQGQQVFLETMYSVSHQRDMEDAILKGGFINEDALAGFADALIILDENGIIHYLNEHAIQLIGIVEKTLLGTRFGKLFEEEEEEEVYFITIDDITEQVSLRKHAKELQKGEAQMAYQAGVAEMGTNVLHNIGNAVGAVSVATEMMRKQVKSLSNIADLLAKGEGVDDIKKLQMALGEGAKAIRKMETEGFSEKAEKISDGVNHIADIIRIQQTMASQDVSQPSTFNLAEMFENVITLQEDSLSRNGIKMPLDLSPDIGDVVLPMNPLMQLVGNLVKNAIEAIKERGKSEKVDGEIRIVTKPGRHDDFTMTIADNGCGIAPRKLKEIFSFGYTTKDRGSGFGLHSAATFVQSVGGTIKADSDGKNRGAVVTISLPLEISKI